MRATDWEGGLTTRTRTCAHALTRMHMHIRTHTHAHTCTYAGGSHAAASESQPAARSPQGSPRACLSRVCPWRCENPKQRSRGGARPAGMGRRGNDDQRGGARGRARLAGARGGVAGGRADLGVRLCPGQGLARFRVRDVRPRHVLRGFLPWPSFFWYNTSNSAPTSAT